jgi:anti-sigma regulatory factor (Ser/Thr protein kinase)
MCDDLPARDDAVILTSELVTNAVLHAGGEITVEIERDGCTVCVAVSDHAAADPVAGSADPSAAGGRGLMLLGALAVEWGVRHDRPGAGKVVWFRLG